MSFFRKRRARDDGRWIVVGLGNPGERYAGHRHNIGAVVIEALASDLGANLKRHKAGCLVAETSSMILARPTSYMNESGRQTSALLRFYGSGPENLIVVHDELDIPFGDIRVKVGGGVAGHNGLKSVAQSIGSKDFARVRFGISRPPGQRDPADHVLSGFSKREREDLPGLIDTAMNAVTTIVEHGPDRAMNEVNTRA